METFYCENESIDLLIDEYTRFDFLIGLVNNKTTMKFNNDKIVINDKNIFNAIILMIDNPENYYYLDKESYEFIVGFLGYKYDIYYDNDYIEACSDTELYDITTIDYDLNKRKNNSEKCILAETLQQQDEKFKILHKNDTHKYIKPSFDISYIENLKINFKKYNISDKIILIGETAFKYYRKILTKDDKIYIAIIGDDIMETFSKLYNILGYVGIHLHLTYLELRPSYHILNIPRKIFKTINEVIDYQITDSTCIAYDFVNNKFITNKRFIYALENQKNTVNFSYDLDPLIVNAWKNGLDIYINDFDYFKRGCSYYETVEELLTSIFTSKYYDYKQLLYSGININIFQTENINKNNIISNFPNKFTKNPYVLSKYYEDLGLFDNYNEVKKFIIGDTIKNIISFDNALNDDIDNPNIFSEYTDIKIGKFIIEQNKDNNIFKNVKDNSNTYNNLNTEYSGFKNFGNNFLITYTQNMILIGFLNGNIYDCLSKIHLMITPMHHNNKPLKFTQNGKLIGNFKINNNDDFIDISGDYGTLSANNFRIYIKPFVSIKDYLNFQEYDTQRHCYCGEIYYTNTLGIYANYHNIHVSDHKQLKCSKRIFPYLGSILLNINDETDILENTLKLLE